MEIPLWGVNPILSVAEIPSDSWAVELGERIARARKRARLTQKELADSTEVSKVWISKLERGLVARPGLRKLHQIAGILGPDVLPPLEDEPRATNVVVRLSDARSIEVRRLPIYRWGAAGDPTDQDNSPDPDHEEFPPPGRESLVGPRGFGVIVRGDSMTSVGIYDGDTVWINPDRPFRMGRPVLARVWADDGTEVGMVVKTIRSGPEGDRLWSEPLTTEPHPSTAFGSKRFEVIGPVVGISPAFRLPEPRL